MRYNGVDPRELHPGISIAKEIPPGTVTSQLETLSGSTGEIVVGRTIQQGEYIVRINIAGRYADEGWAIHRLLTAWARPLDTKLHELVPTHWPTVAFDATLKEISPPEFVFGFVVIDVVFAVPRPIAHDRIASTASTGDTAGSMTVNVGGTSYARPNITITAKEASSTITLYVDEMPYFRFSAPVEAGDVVLIRDDLRIELYDASAATTQDAADKVDYTLTDMQALWEVLTPGRHIVRTEPPAAIDMQWRNEWV